MDCTFEERKEELLSECVVKRSLFAATLERLGDFMKPYVQSMSHRNQRVHAELFVGGLCSDLESKNAESIAYHFERDRKAMQYFIGQAQWDDVLLRKVLEIQIAEQLGEANGVLILDPSAFPKSGTESVGVARQWCGRLGKVDNCQVGLFLGYASSKGHALVDGELYLPREWTNSKARMKKAGVPKAKQRYKTRHEIFLEMLKLHGPNLPHEWITGDDELGRPIGFRRKLQAVGEKYMLAVPCNTKINIVSTQACPQSIPTVRSSIQISKWAAKQASDQWTSINVRDTEKGPLIVEMLTCQVETGHRSKAGIATEMAIAIRYVDRDRSILKQDYYLSNAELATPMSEYARVAKAEHRIEECFDRGKGETGMGDYEVRNWVGWHHHQTMSLIAGWFLNVETRRAEKKDSRHNLQPSSRRSRFDHSPILRMRFTPRRIGTNHQAIDTKPAREALSLA